MARGTGMTLKDHEWSVPVGANEERFPEIRAPRDEAFGFPDEPIGAVVADCDPVHIGCTVSHESTVLTDSHPGAEVRIEQVPHAASLHRTPMPNDVRGEA